MILLDTHIWVWLVQGDERLAPLRDRLDREDQLGLSVFSCWEVAMLAVKHRITLPFPVGDWINKALSYPKLAALHVTPGILVASTQLPGELHSDPADRIIIATAMAHDVPIMTADARILAYAPVRKVR